MSAQDEDRPRLTEARLLRELEIARQEFFASIAASQAALDDVPYHLPSPDGAQYMRNVTRQRDLSYAKYKAALQRLSEYFESARRKDS
jgi:hypothetical protein